MVHATRNRKQKTETLFSVLSIYTSSHQRTFNSGPRLPRYDPPHRTLNKETSQEITDYTEDPMGRKKGKQSGSFGSKSKRSEYYAEIHEHATHHNSKSHRTRPTCSTHDASSASMSTNHKTGINRPRVAVNVNQLRGLLRQRILEDRQRDVNFRRAGIIQNTSSIDMQREKEETNVKSEIETMNVGWLMNYNHRAILAGIEGTGMLDKDDSLEKISILALAPVMNEYVAACGVEYMHERIAALPGEEICFLSSLCRDVDDEIAYILGGHSHVDKLVLNGNDDYYRIGELEEEIGRDEERCLTATGLLLIANPSGSMIPTCADNIANTMVDSWEALSLQEQHGHQQDPSFGMISLNEECSNLKRLELRNFYTDDIFHFAQFLRGCSKLTHLSLSNSLNSIIGEQILLWEDTTVLNGTRTLLDLLPNLQILDLQGCQWLHFDLLYQFVERIMQICESRSTTHDRFPSTPLEMICVGGCSKYVSKQCEYLNTITKQKPLLCIRPPLKYYQL